MKNLTLIFVILLLTISCDRSTTNNAPLNMNFSAHLDVDLRDAAGNNLAGTDGYDLSSMKVTYTNPIPLQGGCTPDYPQNFTIIQENGEKFIRIFLNVGFPDSATANTEVKWGNNGTDIFKSEIIRGENYILVNKIYRNGEMIVSQWQHGRITIIK